MLRESENRIELSLESQVGVSQVKTGRFGMWGWRAEWRASKGEKTGYAKAQKNKNKFKKLHAVSYRRYIELR